MPPITILLRSHFNQAYSGFMEFGGGFFNVSFNTGMHGIWIPGRIRTGRDLLGNYRYLHNQENFYDKDESDTYDEDPGTETSITWRDRAVSISGTRRTDEMTLGSGYTVTLRREFVIYDIIVPVRFYRRISYDGFVGLGLPPPANNDAVADVPIWMTMMNEGLLPSSQFSLYLRYDHSDDINGGSITFGGVDRDHYIGHHQYYDLVDNSYEWKIHMYSVAVAGHLPQYCDKVLIDSGCKYIYGPPHIIYAINRQICGREVPFHGTTVLTEREEETLPQGPDVTFNFYGNDDLTIGPADYVILDVDEQAYTTAFRPLAFLPGDETYFVLGIPWLLRYHTIFDFGERKIGFARSVQ